MTTRAAVRHALARACIFAGAAALPLFLFCFFGSFTIRSGPREFVISDGVIGVSWHGTVVPTYNGFPTMPVRQPEPSGVFLESSAGQWSWMPEWHGPWGTLCSGAIALPLWIPIVLGLFSAYMLLPPGTTRGRCPTCNYDLRGVPPRDAGPLCPECGHAS